MTRSNTPPAGPSTPLPPGLGQAPSPQDTDRYVAWLKANDKAVTGEVYEHVELRVGDWGFFDHGPPGVPLDRAALDRSGHVVTTDRSSAWAVFLHTPGLDATQALEGVAMLFRAGAVYPGRPQGLEHAERVTAPTLSIHGDTATFRGWLIYPPNMSVPMRITITAKPSESTIVHEGAGSL